MITVWTIAMRYVALDSAAQTRERIRQIVRRQRRAHRHHPAADIDADGGGNDRALGRDHGPHGGADAEVNVRHYGDMAVDEGQHRQSAGYFRSPPEPDAAHPAGMVQQRDQHHGNQFERARHGEAKESSRLSREDISSSRRGGLRSHRGPGGRTRDQLYEEAKHMNVRGRSSMNKAELQRAVDRRRSS